MSLLPSAPTSLTISCDDLHQQLIVQGIKLPLSHRTYVLAHRLIDHWREWEAHQCRAQYVSYAVLCQETGAMSPEALRDLVCEARQRLRPYLDIDNVRGKGYYMVLLLESRT